MSRIQILPEFLSNKIAAGEVVERPASVVKELMENALDAQGTRITIEIKNGGRSLIQITDNGTGMIADDALLSLERYATSKISSEQDLFAIRTLGFRGEALPSIAAVSRFTLISRHATTDTGTRIDVSGGRIDQVSKVGAPVGTLIAVKQLFFNTPARRKFLKSVNTEMGHIADGVAAMAMGHPNVRIQLRHNDKILKDWPIATDPADRVVDVLGQQNKSRLFPVAAEKEGVKLSGWIGLPDIFRSTFRGIYLFVNGRFVRDRVIRHALFSGYTGRLMKGRYPLAVLFVTVPHAEVDINVHPTKHEVRFVRQQTIHDLVATAVANTLKESERPNWEPTQPESKPSVIREPVATYDATTVPPPPFNDPSFSLPSQPSSVSNQINWAEPFLQSEPRPLQSAPAPPQPLLEEKISHQFQVIGQFQGTYILCESEGDLFIVDQHAAHERILFEDFKKRYHGGKGPVQRLLVPETIELNFTEADILDRILPEFTRLGLEIDPFGQNTFVVKAYPALLGGGEMAPLIRDILEKIAETGHGPNLDQSLDDCLILMACHGALRANQSLTEAEQKALLGQLMACDNPAHCPHGRPVWIQWSLEHLEKLFGRRV